MTPREELAVLELLGGADVPGNTILEQVSALIADRNRLAREVEQRRRQTDRDTLLASLDDRREDTLKLLSDACLDLADSCDDHGDAVGADLLRAEAKGWGWLGAARKWPTQLKSGDWLWDRPSSSEGPAIFSDQLIITADLLPPNRHFATCRAALEWVVGLISRGEWEPGQAKRNAPEGWDHGGD